MKIAWATLGMVLCFVLGLMVSQRSAVAQAPASPGVFTPAPVEVKKCSFQSDCPYGTCKGGSCGGCSFQSDCGSFGPCNSGRCAKSPY